MESIMMDESESLFDTGQIEITPAAQAALTLNNITDEQLLQWHRTKNSAGNEPNLT